ncbi:MULTISPECIES: serine hydrolase domain-containing protein [unclassified Corallococcus]|uniref:serine hydrolase domain-containing protein n=1 Tax=unclassified Corallococcus TaxID=2685029 RepID=UPI001A8CD940|nr:MULTISPECIES: serine hydrolase domain-containing protein [unclassified Corallococcus]MBN9687498.1 beta-lactamase family protein [Corallococcus sp. NCSPR001]WAS88679.1 serine hydrolase [Corallococcus sp. NCRR]
MSPRAATLSPSRLADVTSALRGHVERGDLPGVVALIARGDTVHVDVLGTQGLTPSEPPMRRDSLFRLASMAKPITAVATLMLVEDGKLSLDGAVDPWLPELADRRVLRTPDGPVDDTVPAKRAITVRDLLTLRWGLGAVMAPPDKHPIQRAMAEARVTPGFHMLTDPPDEFMRRLGSLPLRHQPGERWAYHTGYEVLGVLVARASGMRFDDFLRERLFVPLGMKDTAFTVPPEKRDRLTTAYARDDASGKLEAWDSPADSFWSRQPTFPSGGGQGGLVSTADDLLAFCRMLLGGGQRLLSSASLQEMLTDQIPEEVKAASPFSPGFWDASGWGFGGSITTKPDGVSPTAGRYGWAGGYGPMFFIDPQQDLTALLLTQRRMQSGDHALALEFSRGAYRALED